MNTGLVFVPFLSVEPLQQERPHMTIQQDESAVCYHRVRERPTVPGQKRVNLILENEANSKKMGWWDWAHEFKKPSNMGALFLLKQMHSCPKHTLHGVLWVHHTLSMVLTAWGQYKLEPSRHNKSRYPPATMATIIRRMKTWMKVKGAMPGSTARALREFWGWDQRVSSYLVHNQLVTFV